MCTTPKVGDTINATCVPEKATNVASYVWYTSASTDTTAEWTAISGATSDSYKVTAAEVGKFIKVVVTDTEGATFEAATTASVSEDASADVSIIDVYGLQSDGTGIIGDKLRITYGASFGIPAAITWYKNGAVLKTSTSETNVTQELELEVNAARGVGEYYAVIIDKAGKDFTTNTIQITDKEDAAGIKSFTIEDDYTDGEDVEYQTADNKAIATITLNKNYAGKVDIYKKTDTKFGSKVPTDGMNTNTVAAKFTAAEIVGATTALALPTGVTKSDEQSILATNQVTNYQMVNITGTGIDAGQGVGYINNDGTVTYKWVINTTGLTRGTEYVAVFDQASISTDTPGQGKENVSAAATAPYVKAIKKIAVTKVSNGNKPEVTFYDGDDSVATWFGQTTKNLSTSGIDEGVVYKATAKTNDPKSSDASKVGDTINETNVEKGVWTTHDEADSTQYWFAQIKTKKGVFAADQETITSEASAVAVNAASDMDVIENKDVATTATVSFSNLRTDGKVYIVRGSAVDKSGAVQTDNYKTAEKIFAKFKATDPATYTGVADVEKGAASVDVANAIGKVTGYNHNTTTGHFGGYGETKYTDEYIAVFVPSDETSFGMIYTKGDISGIKASADAENATISSNSTKSTMADTMTGVEITQAVKKYALNSVLNNKKLISVSSGSNVVVSNYIYDSEITPTMSTGSNFTVNDNTKVGNLFTVKDQFGEEIKHATKIGGNFVVNSEKLTFKPTSSKTDIQNTKIGFTWDPRKVNVTNNDTLTDSISLVLEYTTPSSGIASGDKFTATASTGQVFTLECTKTDSTKYNEYSVNPAIEWSLSITQ